MTYNFDPDKWYDNELYLIQSQLKTSEINQNKYDEAVEILDKKLEEMWARLDGTYQIGFDNFKNEGRHTKIWDQYQKK